MDATDIPDLVTTTLASLGFQDLKPLGKRTLYCDRYYVGVRFAFEGVSALWLVGAGDVRFVDDSGKLLKIVALHSSQPNAKQAA